MTKPVRIVKSAVKSILSRFGYRIVPVRIMQKYSEAANDDFMALYREADRIANPEYDRAGDDFSKEQRFHTLYQCVQEVLRKNIPGDFAECGCKHGHSTMIIAKTIEGKNRDLYVFDSFEGGLSDKGKQDRTTAHGDTDETATQQQKRRFASSYDHVKNIFRDMGFVHLVKGWIPDTFTNDLKDKTFAFAHIDVDLYDPIKAALEFFYPRMEPGGVIVLDDYGSSTFPGAKTAVQEFLRENDHSFFLESHTFGCVIVK